MKVLICGKGGCGKSTLAVMLARALERRGRRVLLVDADESNFGLHHLLGVPAPRSLLVTLGGKPGLKARRSDPLGGGAVLPPRMRIDDLPGECLSTRGGVHLLAVGKIEHFGEGCACPIGRLFRDLFAGLVLGDGDVVLVDAEAGIEHFGRRLDGACDLVLTVADPTRESILLAAKVAALSAEAGADNAVVCNRIDPQTLETMTAALGTDSVLAAIPEQRRIFLDNLEGRPLDADLPELEPICRRIESGRRRSTDPFAAPGTPGTGSAFRKTTPG